MERKQGWVKVRGHGDPRGGNERHSAGKLEPEEHTTVIGAPLVAKAPIDNQPFVVTI